MATVAEVLAGNHIEPVISPDCVSSLIPLGQRDESDSFLPIRCRAPNTDFNEVMKTAGLSPEEIASLLPRIGVRRCFPECWERKEKIIQLQKLFT